MSINLGVVDQRIDKITEEFRNEYEERLNIRNDTDKLRTTSFVFLVVKTILDLPDEEVLDSLTEGGQDFGIDALHVGDVDDGEFVVTLFQGKYKKDLSGISNFPQTALEKMIQAVRYLFDPGATISTNERLKLRVEEIRSLIRDGLIPRVRAVACNNGLKWNADAQELIDNSGFPADQVTWEHANHDTVVKLLQAVKPVADTLRLAGKAMVEDFDYCRILVGKLPVREVAELFNRQGDLLLERNVRRYLGLAGNRVNQAIQNTLREPAERGKFYFYNNGITIVCNKFSYNALQSDNYQVRVEGLQVINGGQTCKTIQQALRDRNALPGMQEWIDDGIDKAYVLVRLYELPSGSDDWVRSITYATNSQNPVDLRDLRSNDVRQVNLETSLRELGYEYIRHRNTSLLKPADISSAVAAEAVLSVWKNRPHQAKFQGREHFGKLYDVIFTEDLNGTQVVIATLLYRVAENRRRRPAPGTPPFAIYASCFIAMLMGRYLLHDLGVRLDQLDHRIFAKSKALFDANATTYYTRALDDISAALDRLYGNRDVSLQRLSATFRRGDLIEELLG